MKRNKKAKVFSLFLIFTTLFVSGFVFYLYATEGSKRVPQLLASNELSDFYRKIDSFKFFSQESAQINANAAFSDLLSNFEFAGPTCKGDNGYINFCSIASQNEIENFFETNFLDNFNKQIKNYPYEPFNKLQYSLDITQDTLDLNANKIDIKEDMTESSIIFSFDPSFKFSSDTIFFDFNELYNLAVQCKAKATEAAIADCMKFKNYDVKVKVEGTKVFFDLSAPNSKLENEAGSVGIDKMTIKFFLE
ncbi:hypothetical protein HZA33_01625 [Candidatus Pacearchaeota archaeon]|nr:hypothetical protein [Candidatus Pacearchaeota archaeon]